MDISRRTPGSDKPRKKDALREHACIHCDQPDSSLLRVVLMGEIIRADEATLTAMAKVFQAFGLLDLTEEEAALIPKQSGQPSRSLRLVK